MSEQSFESDDDALSDDDPLLRAVARAPRARDPLATQLLPEPLRAGLGGREPPSRGRLPEPGDVIDGRYRIDARLGEGGMGVVFSATHLQTTKRVALKWMHPGSRLRSDSEQLAARRRFEREARIAARVRHVNVVDVYDASSDAQRSYLVMELLSGETLGLCMARGKLSWDEALALIVPALRGVAALHTRGVIHRDLKPENIYLARAEDGATVPKVLDFGVAALRAVEQDEDETLTGAGTVLGTPGYMPLEQLRGERTLDVRTDVYALGVVLYEALSGKRPVRAGNAAEHAARLATEQPVALGVLVPELRGERSDAVMKALERQREQRYPHVEALTQALLGARPVAHRRVRLLALSGLLLGAASTALGLVALDSDVPTRREHADSASKGIAEQGEASRVRTQGSELKTPERATQAVPSRSLSSPAEATATTPATSIESVAERRAPTAEISEPTTPSRASAALGELANPVEKPGDSVERSITLRAAMGSRAPSLGTKAAPRSLPQAPESTSERPTDLATRLSREDF